MKYLLSNIKSKGKEIKYSKNLECQGYLLPNNFLTVHEQREIFSFRSRMNNLKYNFSDNHKIKEVCLCGEDMKNLHLYECKSLNNIEKTIPYNRLFNGRICEQKYLKDILKENEEKFENHTQAQEILF